jgi:uncharacterized protein YjbJ (UPF0337 family)
MKQHQGGDAHQSKPAKASEQAGPAAGDAHQQSPSQADEGRLRKAAGDVKEILKNSRHQ